MFETFAEAGTRSDKTISYDDINGGKLADVPIELAGLTQLHTGDFIR